MTPPPSARRGSSGVPRQTGAALLMVLLALALVSVTLSALTLQGRRELTRLELLQQETQAEFYARGAEIIARRALTDAAVRHADLWWQTLAGRPLRYPTDAGELRLVVHDLRTCFNLNALGGSQAALAQRQLRYWVANYAGERLTDMTPGEFVTRLADWIDPDNIARASGMDGADYARLDPPRTSADTWLRDPSEINWLAPLDSRRAERFSELCALPDDGPWRLDLNALGPGDLPLLDALFEGQVDRGALATLLRARPPGGYTDLDAVRQVLGGDATWLDRYGNRLRLTPDYVALDIRIRLADRHYDFQRLLLAEGTSAFYPRQPAARVRVLSRRSGYPSARLEAISNDAISTDAISTDAISTDAAGPAADNVFTQESP
ncbi:MAG: general secretion pathway protein GspK [Salinicola sp.]|uniref:type II secretion system minor pseudopilin GspK n=1 Tax=uncultured Salinicola sp. TaxID=1193542 RepID=UPI000C920F2F|nr:type II secretion system minor pseudopilin GspK [uncultured Salinicola sp.]MAM56808.1 general secretion pathway protein GspK [Salinicola sp.]